MKVWVKAVILIAAILIIIVVSSMFVHNYLKSSSQKIINHIENIEENTRNNDWHKAEEIVSTLESLWSDTKSKWSVLIDHNEIDNIDESLTRVSSYIEEREKKLALAELSLLKQMVQHIPEKEALALENVF
ncbi:MAG TPA: DUF4363 family protein [Clostridiaceae bacterium]|nr:DUF4363 family protein [Clostridiaceae bacterium]